MKWGLCFILSASFLFSVTAAIYSSEKDAEIFLRDSSNRLYKLYNEISNITYHIDDKTFFAALDERGLSRNIASLMLEISKEAKKFKTFQFQNPNVIKGVHKLRSADLFVLEEDFFSSLSTALLGLKKIATDKDVCNYTQRNRCNMAYLPDIRKVFTNSADANELLYYWQEMREKHGGATEITHLKNLVELFRKAAYSNGLSVRRFWFRSSEDSNFFTEMEAAMHEIQPIYLDFHAYIRRELLSKYGSTVIDQTGPIPDHLIEQVLLQVWKKQGVLSDSFPRQRLPNLKEGLEAQGFDIEKILEHAEDFYKSLGFDAIPDSIKIERFKEIPQMFAGKDCKADVFDKTPKVYMKYCQASTFKRFLQTHGYLGRVYYALDKKDLPFYFFSSFDLEYPLGEAVILSASTPKHMNRAEILNNFNYTNELSMNRLFRMGVHTIFNLAQYFVNTKVILDVLEGQVPIELINQHYWKLMDEYAGIQPPVDRMTKSIDFSYKFYDEISHNHQTKKFVSEILGYKMYETFCLKSGGFVLNDPNKPLHECDFYGNKDVGTAMRKMMKMGSTTTWQSAIAQILPDSAPMSADSLLQYYKPLHLWLKEKNRLAGTVTGWTASTKTVR